MLQIPLSEHVEEVPQQDMLLTALLTVLTSLLVQSLHALPANGDMHQTPPDHCAFHAQQLTHHAQDF
jgi:hypothetical protein